MKAAIFDFDGTLANTASVLQKIYNQIAKQKGWPKISSQDYLRLRKGTLGQAMQWAGIHYWQLPALLYKGRKQFQKEVDKVQLFTGMDKLVIDLQADGWDIFILSQNSEKAVRKFLKNNNLDKNIEVLHRASILGKHRNLRKFIRSRGYAKSNIWMIGDEVRDIEASHKAGIKIMAVTWGLQDSRILQRSKPNKIANSPEEIKANLC